MRLHFKTTALSVILLAASFFFTSCHNADKENNQLIFLSGAGMKAPVTELAKMYEHDTGIKIETHFEGSSVLRDYILSFKTGDVFLPGDEKNLDTLARKKLIKERYFIARHTVSILVAPGQTERIKCLDDLAQDGVRLAMSNPRLASLGKIVMKNIIDRHPLGADILKNVVTYGSSSVDVLRIYHEGGIDAVIEWNVMAATEGGKGLKVVPLPEPYQVQDKLYIGLLTTSREPEQAKQFYEYLKMHGRKIFQKHGYDTTPPKDS